MNYTHNLAMEKNSKLKKYENHYNTKIEDNAIIILRFDGVNMTRNFLKNNNRKATFLLTIKKTIEIFMKEYPKIKVAYSYADEISLLLSDEVIRDYDYRVEKLVSIFTSRITGAFYLAAKQMNLELNNHIYSFDGRVIALPSFNQFIRYLESRQIFNISRHFELLKNKYLKEEKIENTDSIKEELSKKGFNYYGINKHERYGLLWIDNKFINTYEFCNEEYKLRKQVSKYIVKKEQEVNV